MTLLCAALGRGSFLGGILTLCDCVSSQQRLQKMRARASDTRCRQLRMGREGMEVRKGEKCLEGAGNVYF